MKLEQFYIKKEKVFYEAFGYDREQKCYVNVDPRMIIKTLKSPSVGLIAMQDRPRRHVQKEVHKRGDITTCAIKDTFVRTCLFDFCSYYIIPFLRESDPGIKHQVLSGLLAVLYCPEALKYRLANFVMSYLIQADHKTRLMEDVSAVGRNTAQLSNT